MARTMSDVCGIPGLPTMDETIDDIVIYASISAIDGPGKILAEAGPCVFRCRAGIASAARGKLRSAARRMRSRPGRCTFAP